MVVRSAKFQHFQECCGHLDASLCVLCKAAGKLGVSSKSCQSMARHGETQRLSKCRILACAQLHFE